MSKISIMYWIFDSVHTNIYCIHIHPFLYRTFTSETWGVYSVQLITTKGSASTIQCNTSVLTNMQRQRPLRVRQQDFGERLSVWCCTDVRQLLLRWQADGGDIELAWHMLAQRGREVHAAAAAAAMANAATAAAAGKAVKRGPLGAVLGLS